MIILTELLGKFGYLREFSDVDTLIEGLRAGEFTLNFARQAYSWLRFKECSIASWGL